MLLAEGVPPPASRDRRAPPEFGVRNQSHSNRNQGCNRPVTIGHRICPSTASRPISPPCTYAAWQDEQHAQYRLRADAPSLYLHCCVTRRERSSSSNLLSTPPTSSPGPSSSNALSGPSRTPYRPGFQPKGVSRSRTEEFVVVRLGREERREGRRGEEKRLARRLDKIIALHFTPRSVLDEREVKKSKTAVEGERRRKEERPKGHHRRESSLVDDLLVEGKSPRDVWKSWKERSFSGSNNNLNALSENGDEKGKGKLTAEQKRGASF